MYRYSHPDLGPILGHEIPGGLVQFRSIPYATIPQRFARSQLLKSLSVEGEAEQYDASQWGPSSIQRLDCIETDLEWNQLPRQPTRLQSQSEDCLRVTLTVPETNLVSDAKVPVLAFIHGGALAVASGERYYYDPTKLCRDALTSGKPLIFVSIDYRLGALGFLHAPEAQDLLPPNNGLHDQLRAFEWIQAFIGGFGGDPNNVTVIGQSAGAASLSVHNVHPRAEPLYRQSIVLSGSSTVLVTKSPQQHQADFQKVAENLKMAVKGRPTHEVAQELIEIPLDSMRRVDLHGAFCYESELIPDQNWSTMRYAQTSKPNTWLQSQIIGSCTYDGSISYLVEHAKNRTNRSSIFQDICKARMEQPQKLLDLYEINDSDPDDEALYKICQIVTDSGFYAPAVSLSQGGSSSQTDTYMLLFDIPNPWPGALPQGKCASHTLDVVSLLGPYEDQLPDELRPGVAAWRECIIDYCHGEKPGHVWRPDNQHIQHVTSHGLDELGPQEIAERRAEKLLKLAREEGGEDGFDILWENVVRHYLDSETHA